jgi:hypothetical protein
MHDAMPFRAVRTWDGAMGFGAVYAQDGAMAFGAVNFQRHDGTDVSRDSARTCGVVLCTYGTEVLGAVL